VRSQLIVVGKGLKKSGAAAAGGATRARDVEADKGGLNLCFFWGMSGLSNSRRS